MADGQRTPRGAVRCPFCDEDRQIERTKDGWFCNTCGKEFR